MTEFPHARSFTELTVYQISRAVAARLFELSNNFPPEERYALTDQLRRSCRSIGAQIAEAWAKRRYTKHFVSKLTDADAEQLETQHWVHIANACGYLTQEEEAEILDDLARIGRMLNSMMRKAESFCQTKRTIIRDARASYSRAAPPITDHRSPITDY